jgi:enoyl-[acyl-carrier protein] reductase I
MTSTTPLKGLVVGVANEHSIAWGCTKVFHQQGSQLAMTYVADKMKHYVEPLAQQVNADIFMPLDVSDEAQFNAVFDAIEQKWGKLDFLLHSIAFAPKADLQGRVVDSSAEGFREAMDVSCHSLIRMCKRAESLMKDGGSILTMSYYGAEKVVNNYNIMGPVKAALEASVRYVAKELGQKGIRVNALSPGPVMTRAASGLAHFDNLIEKSAHDAPLHDLVSIEQIGEAAAFLVSPKAKHITGQTIYVDNGYNTLG